VIEHIVGGGGRDVDLTYYATFREVALRQSFTRAAEELGYAQSSVTAQIQKLERAYGVQLIERYGRKLRLTSPGEELLKHATKMLEIYEESKEAIARQSSGRIAIGAIDSLASYYLPFLLHEFRQDYPDLAVRLQPDNEPDLLERVREGQLDLALLLDNKRPDSSLYCEIVREEKLLLIASSNHPLAGFSSVTLDHLNDMDWIMSEESCNYRMMLEHVLRTNGIRYRITYELGNPEAVKRCVKNGLGIALLPEMVVAEEAARGDIVALPLEHADLKLSLQLVMHPKKWISKPLEDLITNIREGADS
jgi:DNA-binding transcriptional LysR family regulator